MKKQRKNAKKYLDEAKKLHRKAAAEFVRAKEKGDGVILRDACGKGWLSTVEAANALLVKRGVKEEELPRTDRGRRFMINKYAEGELRLYYFSLRDNLHIEGYYDGSLNFDEVDRQLEDLNLYIKKIEELKPD